MITEAMAMKGLAAVGAWTIGTTLIGPVFYTAGKFIGQCAGSLVNRVTKGNNSRKAKVETVDEVDETTAKAIQDLLDECNKALAENEKKDLAPIVISAEEQNRMEEERRMREWIQRCKDQYGGFAKVNFN